MHKRLSALFSAIIISLIVAFSGAAQTTEFEKEAWNFALDYEKAIFQNDIAFLEKHKAEDFLSLGPNQSQMTRRESLENARRNATAPFFRLLDLSSRIVRIKTSGSLAIITTHWKVVRVPAKEKDTAAQTDTGSSTTVYEKRENQWFIVSEHVAFDAPRPEDPVKEVGAASNAYSDMLIAENFDALDKTLVRMFVSTDENGVSREKAAFLDELRAPDLTIRRIRNTNVFIRFYRDTAIETGLNVIEVTRGAAPATITRRYTRHWVFIDQSWKLFAEHFSRVDE